MLKKFKNMFLLIIIELLFSTLIIINLKIYKMSKTEIKNPLQKPIFKSFINQFIQIHYFQKGGEESREIENCKRNMIWPSTASVMSA